MAWWGFGIHGWGEREGWSLLGYESGLREGSLERWTPRELMISFSILMGLLGLRDVTIWKFRGFVEHLSALSNCERGSEIIHAVVLTLSHHEKGLEH